MKPSTILKWALISLIYLMSIKPIHATGTHCTVLTKAGIVCKAWATKGSDKCYMHSPANRCEGTKKDGAKCGGLKMKNSKYCSAHQNQK